MMDFSVIKQKIAFYKEWLYQHPKEFYKYSFAAIIICFTISVVNFIFFPPTQTKGLQIPMVFSKSDEKIEVEKAKRDKKLAQMRIIVTELEKLKTKRENEKLSQSDSLRIEYLYNQYQTLQNGN